MTITDKQVEAAWRAYWDCDEKDGHAKIRAALKAADAAAWQDIATAPRDGTEILASAADPMATGRNYIAVAQWAKAADWMPNSVAGWFWTYAIRPTSWRPLPQPPKETT